MESSLKLSREGGKNVVQRITYDIGDDLEEVSQSATKRMESVLSVGIAQLVEEHESAWKELLHTGIHLDPTDPGNFKSIVYYFLEKSCFFSNEPKKRTEIIKSPHTLIDILSFSKGV